MGDQAETSNSFRAVVMLEPNIFFAGGCTYGEALVNNIDGPNGLRPIIGKFDIAQANWEWSRQIIEHGGYYETQYEDWIDGCVVAVADLNEKLVAVTRIETWENIKLNIQIVDSSNGHDSKTYRVQASYHLKFNQNQVTVLDEVAYILTTRDSSDSCDVAKSAWILKVTTTEVSILKITGANYGSAIYADTFYHQIFVGLAQCSDEGSTIPILGRFSDDVMRQTVSVGPSTAQGSAPSVLDHWYNTEYGKITGINQSIVSGSEFQDDYIQLWSMRLSASGAILNTDSVNKIVPLKTVRDGYDASSGQFIAMNYNQAGTSIAEHYVNSILVFTPEDELQQNTYFCKIYYNPSTDSINECYAIYQYSSSVGRQITYSALFYNTYMYQSCDGTFILAGQTQIASENDESQTDFGTLYGILYSNMPGKNCSLDTQSGQGLDYSVIEVVDQDYTNWSVATFSSITLTDSEERTNIHIETATTADFTYPTATMYQNSSLEGECLIGGETTCSIESTCDGESISFNASLNDSHEITVTSETITQEQTIDPIEFSSTACQSLVEDSNADGIVYTAYNAETFEIYTSDSTPISFDATALKITYTAGPDTVTANQQVIMSRILAQNIDYGLSVRSPVLVLTINACYAPEITMPVENNISYLVGYHDSTSQFQIFDSSITMTQEDVCGALTDSSSTFISLLDSNGNNSFTDSQGDIREYQSLIQAYPTWTDNIMYIQMTNEDNFKLYTQLYDLPLTANYEIRVGTGCGNGADSESGSGCTIEQITAEFEITHYCRNLSIQSSASFEQTHLFTTSDSGEYIFEYDHPELSFTENRDGYCTIEVLALMAASPDLTCIDDGQSLNNVSYTELNPPEENRWYSSIYNGGTIGEGIGASMLDNGYGWSSDYSDYSQSDEWMVIDAGEVLHIAGIIVQGRGFEPDGLYTGQIVTRVTLQYKDAEFTRDELQYGDSDYNWSDVQYNEEQETATEFQTGIEQGQYANKYYITFDQSISARYIKILPQDGLEWISLRAGLLVSSTEIESAPSYNSSIQEFNYYSSTSGEMVKFYLYARVPEIVDIFLAESYYDWSTSGTGLTTCTTTDGVTLLEIKAFSCSSATISSPYTLQICTDDTHCEEGYSCHSDTRTCAQDFNLMLYASSENTSDSYTHGAFESDFDLCPVALRAYTCGDTYPCTQEVESYIDYSTVVSTVGPISYSEAEGVFTFFKSYPVTAAQEKIIFYLDSYILEPDTDNIAKTGDTYVFILTIDACYEPNINPVISDDFTVQDDGTLVFPFEKFGPNDSDYSGYKDLFSSAMSDPTMLACDFTADAFEIELTAFEAYDTSDEVSSYEFTEYCAEQWEDCEIEGTRWVRYVSNQNPTAYYQGQLTGTFNCMDHLWGDPYIGTSKKCYLGVPRVESLLNVDLSVINQSIPSLSFDLTEPDQSQQLYQYWVNCQELDWNDARDACQKWDGELVSIHSQEHADYIQYEVLQNKVDSYWIGKWNNNNGDFVWQDGSKSTFDNKADGTYIQSEGSIYTGTNSCVALNSNYWPYWDQHYCESINNSGSLFKSICYKDVENGSEVNSETGIQNKTNQGQMAFRLLQDKKLTYTLTISQPISSFSTGGSSFIYEQLISVTPSWYCSTSTSYAYQQDLEDISFYLKPSQTEDWNFTLPTLQYEYLNNKYCPISLQVRNCTYSETGRTFLCEDTLDAYSKPAYDSDSLTFSQEISLDIETFDFYLFAQTTDVSGTLNVQSQHLNLCDTIYTGLDEYDSRWGNYKSLESTYSITDTVCPITQSCVAKKVTVNIEMLSCSVEDIEEPELELWQEFVYVPGTTDTLTYTHPQFKSEYGCVMVYEAYTDGKLLSSESTPIAYDPQTQTFLFTGSLNDIGMHSFDLKVMLEDLTEVGSFSFKLAIYEQATEFSSEPESSFDFIVDQTSSWSYTLPSLAPGFETYICKAKIESSLQQFIEYAEGTFSLIKDVAGVQENSYQIEIFCRQEDNESETFKLPDASITINFIEQEEQEQEEVEEEPEVDNSFGQKNAENIRSEEEQVVKTPELFNEPFVIPSQRKKPQPPSIMKKVQTNYFSPQLTINLRQPLISTDNFMSQERRQLQGSSPSLLKVYGAATQIKVSYISQDVTDDTANMDTFNWNITNITETSLGLSLDFTDPGAVSLSSQWDWVFVEFVPDKDDFGNLSQEDLKPVREMVQVPPQIEKEIIETIEEAGSSMTTTVSAMACINFILKLILASSVDRYMSMVNIMQIFVLYGLFEVSLTPQIISFFSFICQIATFEILPENVYDFERVFDFNTDTEFSARFGLMSFDSTSFMKVLGFLFIVFCFVLAQFAVLGLLKLLRKCESKGAITKKLDKWIKKLTKELFWSTPLAYIIESFLDICLGCGLFIIGSIPADYHYGDYIDALLCFFFLIMIIFVPLFVLTFMCQRKHKFAYAKRMEKKYKLLKKTLLRQARYQIRVKKFTGPSLQEEELFSSDEEVPERRSVNQIHLDSGISNEEFLQIKQIRQTMREFDVLLENLDPQKKNSMSVMYFIFMVRRAAIIALIFFSPDKTYVQLQTVIYMQLFYTIWMCQSQPYKKKTINAIEIANESLSLYILYFFTMLNDPSPTSATRAGISYSILIIAGMILFANGTLMVRGILKDTCGKNGSVKKCLRKTQCFGICNKLFQCEKKKKDKKKKAKKQISQSEMRKKLVQAAIKAIRERRLKQQNQEEAQIEVIDQLVYPDDQKQANQIQPQKTQTKRKTLKSDKKGLSKKQKLKQIVETNTLSSPSKILSQTEINAIIENEKDLIAKTLNEDEALYQDTIENSFDEPIEAFKDTIRETLREQNRLQVGFKASRQDAINRMSTDIEQGITNRLDVNHANSATQNPYSNQMSKAWTQKISRQQREQQGGGDQNPLPKQKLRGILKNKTRVQSDNIFDSNILLDNQVKQQKTFDQLIRQRSDPYSGFQ